MILFEEDWARYPSAIPDYQTKNESFIRMVGLYRDMGVTNCLFPLTLLQPELQGIDPHSEGLTPEIKTKIALECKYNIWYVLREVIRIPPMAGPVPISYIANRGNMALTWLFFAGVSVMLIQPRQTGKSVGVDCIADALTYLMLDNTLISLLTKDSKLRVKNIERLKRIRDLLPSYLVPKHKEDLDNQTDLTCKMLGNHYITAVAQSSESAAINLGRGHTSPVTLVDEFPYVKNIRHTLPVLLASGIQAKQEAIKNDRPHADIFTTTAGKKDDPDGSYAYQMLTDAAVWNEAFLDCKNKKDLKLVVDKNCAGRMTLVNCTFNHRQLGKTDEWLYNVIATTKAEGDNADRDLFNIWTSGSLSSPLSIKVNETIKKSIKEPKYLEITNDSYAIRWYKEKDELDFLMSNTSVLCSIDTSDAIGRDFISLVFMDATTLEIIGCASINETNLIKFAHMVAEVLIKYLNVTLIIERKSSAQAIIDSLLITLPSLGIDPFKRIYNKIVDDNLTLATEFKEIQTPMERRDERFYERYKKYFGFNTTGASRALLFSTVLQDAAKSSGDVINDCVLADELLGLVVKNGRIDHVTGGHDDMVIAWLMGHWLLTFSRNLVYYGIDATKIMSNIASENSTIVDPIKLAANDRKEILLKSAEGIYDKLSNTSSAWEISKYESQLKRLNSKTDISSIDSNSIDGMIKNAADMRKKRRLKTSLDRRRLHR